MPLISPALPLVGELQAGMVWSPGTPRPGTTVTFTTTASDGDGAINFARMCWGDSTGCNADASAPALSEQLAACAFGDNWSRQWTHKYIASGDYQVTLFVSSRGCPALPDETAQITYTIRVRT